MFVELIPWLVFMGFVVGMLALDLGVFHREAHAVSRREEGGRIDVRVQVRNGRCLAQVSDTGVGLHASSAGLGTGLATLRERLQLSFGPTATLSLTPQQPHGVCAELDFPAQRGQA